MKRMHIHTKVSDLTRSVEFYSAMFACRPTVLKPDYAKWMLDDPRVNFAISAGRGAAGVEHLGIQAEDAGELAEVYGRIATVDAPVVDEGATTCCYAKSQKSWVADPDGVVWETFLTDGEATVYGTSATIDSVLAKAQACPCPSAAP